MDSRGFTKKNISSKGEANKDGLGNGMNEKLYSELSLSTFSGCNEANCNCKKPINGMHSYKFNSSNTAYATVPYFPQDNLINGTNESNIGNNGNLCAKRFWSSDNFINNMGEYENGLPRGYSIYHGWGNNNNNCEGGNVYNGHNLSLSPYISGNYMNSQTNIGDLRNLECNIGQTYPFRPLHPLEHLKPFEHLNPLGSRYGRNYGGSVGNNLNDEEKVRRRNSRPFCC